MGSGHLGKRRYAEREDSDDDNKRKFQITLVLDPSNGTKKQKIDLSSVRKKVHSRIYSEDEDEDEDKDEEEAVRRLLKGRRVKDILDENATLTAEVARLRAKLKKYKNSTPKEQTLESCSPTSDPSSSNYGSGLATSRSSSSASDPKTRAPAPCVTSELAPTQPKPTTSSRSNPARQSTPEGLPAPGVDSSASGLEVIVPERSIAKLKVQGNKLRELLGLNNDKRAWSRYLANIRRILAVSNIDWDMTWKQQSIAETLRILNMIEEEMPAFKRFFNQWGAEWMATNAFNHRRAHLVTLSKPPGERGRKRKMDASSSDSEVEFV
ncbi:hypothetical protein RhiJN_23488 [Ceratobasidium sp. AG-Ba]|nr:hypothetical protein RhiJN_23488 [Ceratobasidium sp. AG-Ba]